VARADGILVPHLRKALFVSGNFMRPFVLILSFLFFACNNSSTEHNSFDKDTTKQIISQDTGSKVVIADTAKSVGTKLYVWSVDFDNKTKKRNSKFKNEYLNVDSLLKGLNELYPDIRINKVKISGDTLFTRIIDSEYLVERIGSSGAALYLADVIINLTSVHKIKYVKIDFEEGSHAAPGIWSEKDFSDYKEIH
jgi:hypothetical protein